MKQDKEIMLITGQYNFRIKACDKVLHDDSLLSWPHDHSTNSIDHAKIMKTDAYKAQLAFAERLVLCLNAHASLQAKADLHDELVGAFERLINDHPAQLGLAHFKPSSLIDAEQALAKAKKLTGEQENET